ncbi:hypothetical protein ACTA71_003732 [Dictyostelium dimigraforme]
MSLKIWNPFTSGSWNKNDKKITKKEFIEALGYNEKEYYYSDEKRYFNDLDPKKSGEVTETELYDYFQHFLVIYFINDVLRSINLSDTLAFSDRKKDDIFQIIKGTLMKDGLEEKNAEYAIKMVAHLIEKDGIINSKTIVEAFQSSVL